MFIASQVSARDFYKGEMSKLTTQQALPRRKLFKPEPPDRIAESAEITKFMTQSVALRRGRKLTKRKAKKAKRKP